MLAKVADGPVRWMGLPNNQPMPSPPLDEAWVVPAMAAIDSGLPFAAESTIANKDRAVGARLAGELAVRRAQGELSADVTYKLKGTAGQSLGAFTVEGMKLELEGQANDVVGKGWGGGELVIRARGLAARDSGQHLILGNVALYGAT